MRLLNIDSSMSERSAGPPAARGGYRQRDYALYEIIDMGAEKLFAYELYANRKPKMSIAAGFNPQDVEPNGFVRRISFDEVHNDRRPEISDILKKRGYKEPIAFL